MVFPLLLDKKGAGVDDDAGGGAGAAFAPSDIEGLTMWLKADAGTWQDAAMTTAAASDGDPVGGWADQSDNANNATQATADNKPTLKLNILGGKPVLRFDGTNDLLAFAKTTIGASITVFVVGKINTTNTLYGIFCETITSTNRFEIGASNFGNLEVRKYIGSYVAGSNIKASDTDYHIITAWIDSDTTANIYVDGVIGSAGGSIAPSSTATRRIGSKSDGTSPLAGDIAEIIAYSSALSDTDRESVRDYLTDRFF